MARLPRFRVQLVRDGSAPLPARLEGPSGAVSALQECIGDVPHEEMWVLLLDARTRLTGAVKVSQGGVSGCAVMPADVLRPVVAHGAAGFIVGHNHPSGDPTPSADDRRFTRAIAAGARAVGVPLLDSLVVTAEGNWRSMAEECES